MMSEDFLYFLWQFQHFAPNHLQISSGETLQVLAVGQRNTNAGPDFLNGRVLIGGLEWAGTIEMHLKSSDWHRHAHTNDHAYDSVVLHVVWQNDKTIVRPDGTSLPTLELKQLVSKDLLFKYHKLIDSKDVIPCASQFASVADIQKRVMLDRALMQRLQRKAEVVHDMLNRNGQDWEETTYQLLTQNFGFKINAEPMLRLAQGMPLKILQKHRDSLPQLEAMLLGQSGLFTDIQLDEYPDEYIETIEREYDFLATKYTLRTQQLRPQEWRFLRLRPANFPTVRLAQLAALIQQQTSLFSLFIYSDNLKMLENTLRVPQSAYWQKHYQFQKEAVGKVSMLGKSSVENIVVNTAVPLLVAYSEAKDNRTFLDKAIALLEQLPAEKNHIVSIWEDLKFKPKTAFDAQASIELYHHFCTQKRCLSCSVGISLLKPEKPLDN